MTNANYVTLSHFTCPAVQTTKYFLSLYVNSSNSCRNRYALSVPTYRYLYAGNFTNISPRPWEGAYHCSELPMFFGTSGIAHGGSTPFELVVSRSMQDMYLAFITDGPAGLETKGWKAYTPNGAVLEFGKEIQWWEIWRWRVLRRFVMVLSQSLEVCLRCDGGW
jgi:carboxylesterase type B